MRDFASFRMLISHFTFKRTREVSYLGSVTNLWTLPNMATLE